MRLLIQTAKLIDPVLAVSLCQVKLRAKAIKLLHRLKVTDAQGIEQVLTVFNEVNNDYREMLKDIGQLKR